MKQKEIKTYKNLITFSFMLGIGSITIGGVFVLFSTILSFYFNLAILCFVIGIVSLIYCQYVATRFFVIKYIILGEVYGSSSLEKR